MKIIDLSYTIDNECMTCGTPWHERVMIKNLGTIGEVGRNTSIIHLGSHTGTHMDAPLHFYDGAEGINKANLEKICGTCTVIDMTNKGTGDIVNLKDVEGLSLTSRVLFRFDWFKNWKTDQFYKDFPYFSMEAAQYIVKSGVKVVALDTPSPDTGKAIGEGIDSPVHKLFLENDITIIEYLKDTDKINMNAKNILVALPLKIKDCDGSPARVIIMEEI